MPTIPDYFHCIVCDRPLRPCFLEEGESDLNTSLYRGCQFQFFGAYGTTLFDPAPGDPENHVEIAVCDWCLIAKKDRARVYLKDQSVQPFSECLKSVRGPGDPEEYDRKTQAYSLAQPHP
jgi:hypothetical protein